MCLCNTWTCMWNLGMYYVLRITVTVNTSENTRTWWNNLALWGWSLPVQPPLGLTDTRPTLGPTARYTTAPTQQETSPILHDIKMFIDHAKIILSSIDNWTTWCWIKLIAWLTKLINKFKFYVIMWKSTGILYNNKVYKCVNAKCNKCSFFCVYNFFTLSKETNVSKFF